ncbi:MAG TPA: trypsin-like peptidase domain-containing protein [Longimicrobiaceae bacterium]|nr:trypsin-like peptidase domain-containing protein [Longimicrobiaceae bacterium]
MLDPVRAKAKLVAFTAAAFAGGVLLASGLEWTTGSHAATLLQTAPSRAEIQPVADMSQAFISIAESVTPAVVSIETERRGGSRRGGGRQIPEELREFFPFFDIPEGGRQIPQLSGGSGFIIAADGYIMTNNHVVENATEIDVVLQDNRRLKARLVGADPLTDVAVIKVEGNGFPTVRIGRSEGARIGEWVLAIGNPLDLGTTVTSGIISAKGRSLGIIGQTAQSNWAIEDFIQTDAAINPGNSGGPLVNLRGEVIGINSVIASRTGYYSGYGFAIPIDLARRIGEDLIRFGRVRRAALGVSVREVTPDDAEVYRLERITGVLVNDFEANSPARRAGVRQGDVIVAVNGQPVQTTGELQRRVTANRPGETVTLDVIRTGERRQIRVELIEAPVGQQGATAGRSQPRGEEAESGEVSTRKLGIQVAPLTADLARQYEFRRGGGVVITRVEPYGVLGRRGIPAGFKIVSADGQPINDVGTLQRIVEAKRPNEVISLTLENPQGQQSIVNVRLPAQE